MFLLCFACYLTFIDKNISMFEHADIESGLKIWF